MSNNTTIGDKFRTIPETSGFFHRDAARDAFSNYHFRGADLPDCLYTDQRSSTHHVLFSLEYTSERMHRLCRPGQHNYYDIAVTADRGSVRNILRYFPCGVRGQGQ